jgi:hypothetical protein
MSLIIQKTDDCGNKLRNTPDWRMFWAIEHKDSNTLTKICEELQNSKKDIGMYFGSRVSWKNVFNDSEAKLIKVYLCGLMDFSPIQHAGDIGWIEGMKILFDHNIGCNIQGCGLNWIDKARFLIHWETLNININIKH